MSNELANMKKLLYRTISSEYTNTNGDKLEVELFDYLIPTKIVDNCLINIYLKFYNKTDGCLGDMTFTFSSSYSNNGEKISVNNVKTTTNFVDRCVYSINKIQNNDDIHRFIFLIPIEAYATLKKIDYITVNFEIMSGYLEDIRCQTFDKNKSSFDGVGTSIYGDCDTKHYSGSIFSGSSNSGGNIFYKNYLTSEGIAVKKSNSIDDAVTITENGIFVKNDNNVNVISLTTNGEVTAQSFNAQSDKRLKTNIVDYSPNKSILDLPIKEFDYITTEKHAIGCIAQDLQEICPEIVDEDDKGYLSIQESKLVYLLLDEVKKLRAELDELKGR